jgi:hypothetical protein
MKQLIVFFLLNIALQNAFCQAFEVPEMNIKPNTQEEYEKLEPQVLACINWLNTTPLSIEPEKRQKASAYVTNWLMGTKKVNVMIDGYVLNYAEKNPEMMIAFLNGWAKYAIENPQMKESYPLALAGMRNMVLLCKNNIDLYKKNKKFRKLLEMETNGELENWLKSQLK